jgi:hypothetical protein
MVYLIKDKKPGHRSIRGAVALACIYFNQDRSGLLEFLKNIDIDVNDELITNIFPSEGTHA